MRRFLVTVRDGPRFFEGPVMAVSSVEALREVLMRLRWGGAQAWVHVRRAP